jgi:hypothetical protein
MIIKKSELIKKMIIKKSNSIFIKYKIIIQYNNTIRNGIDFYTSL